MMVETFKNQELENVIFDLKTQNEWKELAGELGLNSQLSFTESAKSPLPYPWMNTSMTNVFRALCPASTTLDRYNKTPIPIEVLREIKFCVGENYFDAIKIWYDDKSPDPIAVGEKKMYKTYYRIDGVEKDTDYEFSSEEEAKSYVALIGAEQRSVFSETKRYLIARWADELRPMDELRKLAIARLTDKYTNDWKLTIENLTNKVSNASKFVQRYIDGDISQWDLERGL